MNFKYRFQLVRTIRLSTHNDILEEKKIQKFFGVGGKNIISFPINHVKSPKEFLRDNEFVA